MTAIHYKHSSFTRIWCDRCEGHTGDFYRNKEYWYTGLKYYGKHIHLCKDCCAEMFRILLKEEEDPRKFLVKMGVKRQKVGRLGK